MDTRAGSKKFIKSRSINQPDVYQDNSGTQEILHGQRMKIEGGKPAYAVILNEKPLIKYSGLADL